MADTISMHPYRIIRLVELTSNTCPLIVNRATQGSLAHHDSATTTGNNLDKDRHHFREWPVLMGQFIARKRASQLHPHAGIPTKVLPASPSILFMDPTGVIECEFARDFDVAWLANDTYLCYLLEWNYIPYNTANGGKRCYLEVCSLPRFFTKSHSLASITSYDIDHTIVDLLLDSDANTLDPQPATLHSRPSAQYLSDQYTPVTLGLHHQDVQVLKRTLAECKGLTTLSIYGKIQAKGCIQEKRKDAASDKIKYFSIQVACKHHQTELFGDAILTAFVCYEDSSTDTELDILHYHKQLKVGRWYLFTDLKASKPKFKLNANASFTRKVLNFEVGKSRLFDLNSSDLSVFNLNMRNMVDDCDVQTVKPAGLPMHPASSSAPKSLISYSGRISRIVNVDQGFYELDGKIMLVLTHYQIAGPGFGLRLGAGLQLHNVHLVLLNDGLAKTPVSLIACSYSTLEINEFSAEATDFQMITGKRREEFMRQCRGLNVVDVLLMISIKSEMTRKFDVSVAQAENSILNDDNRRINSNSVSVKWKTKFYIDILTKYGFKPYERDSLATPFDHQDLCTLATIRYRPPSFPLLINVYNHPLVLEFRNIVISNAQKPHGNDNSTSRLRNDSLNPAIRSRVFSQDELNWKNVSLMGVLTAGDHGILVLKDQTHAVGCVVIASSDDKVIQPHHLNLVWVINRYEIVTETLGLGFTQCEKDFRDVVFERLAIRFCIVDAFCVGQAPNPELVQKGKARHAPRGARSQYLGIVDAVQPVQQILSADGRIEYQSWMVVAGCKYKTSENGISELLGSEQLISILFTNPADVVALRRGDTYAFRDVVELSPDEDDVDDETANDSKPAKRDDDEICVAFDGRSSVRSFSLDLIDLTTDTLPRQDDDSQPLVVRLSPDHGEVLLKIIPPSSTSEICRVSSILQNIAAYKKRPQHAGMVDTLINLKGIIVSKEYRPVEEIHIPHCSAADLFVKHGIGTGDYKRTMLIKIRDTEGADTMDVYVDLRRSVYPAGMLPGISVTFRKLALKISSRSSNIYGSTIPITSIEVGPPTTIDRVAKPIVQRSNARVRLSDFFSRANGHTMIPLTTRSVASIPGINATITHIQHVLFKHTCTTCGASFLDAACPHGHGSGNGVLSAYARFFIDDGSAEAVVHVDDVDAVFSILKCDGAGRGGPRAKFEKIAMRYGDVSFRLDPPWFCDDADGCSNGEGLSLVTLGVVAPEKESSVSQPKRVIAQRDKANKDAEFIEAWCVSVDLKRSVIAYCRAQSSFASLLVDSENNDGDNTHEESAEDLMVSKEALGRRTIRTDFGCRLTTLTHPRIVLRGDGFQEVERSEAHFLIKKLGLVGVC
ncbi:hypothetical protein SeMB42_g04201 [Synchytrium endobioticum]|uniref:CST complex subunit CTC1 n=1 Tax=Synchytrium endobioticum TaxID=286115 RepID=A0A507D0J4_9FUNG|nr:hypothetical protein SeMB42_g04201 [Synchytrium endobioticum]